MARVEDFQNRESQGIKGTNALMLSQSVQNLFEAKSGFSSQNKLLALLDFGTGSELCLSAAYTGDSRSSARAFMADETDQKLDASKIQAPSDVLARPSVIRTKEDEAIWDEMQKPHKLGKHESATHIGLTPEVIAEMQAKGQASKLEFFDSTAEGALAALQEPPKEKPTLLANVPESKDVVSDMTRGGLPMSGTLLPEPWMVKAGADMFGILSSIAFHVTAAKFQETLDSVKKAVVNPIEHPFRGHEEETLALMPKASWSEAYKAFPDLKKDGALSEDETVRLMKAIVGNELTFYGPEDKAQDAICDAGQGRFIMGKTVGFAQIAPEGVRKVSAEFDAEVKNGKRNANPLAKLAALSDDELAKAMLKPENVPLLVAANISHNLEMFKRHPNEVEINPLTLGYHYNPDCVYATSDAGHKNVLTKKEADRMGIDTVTALPSAKVLEKSEHAHNIEKWLKKLGG